LPAGVAARGGLVHEFALGLGLVGLAMLVMQFWLTARLRRMTAPFGIDVIYYFHRFLALTLCAVRSEEHTSELQSREKLVCRLLRRRPTAARLPYTTLFRSAACWCGSKGRTRARVRAGARARWPGHAGDAVLADRQVAQNDRTLRHRRHLLLPPLPGPDTVRR